MKYSLTFLLLAIACVTAGLGLRHSQGWGFILFAYLGLSFGLMSAAYALRSPAILMKRPDGGRALAGTVLLLPYLLLNRLAFDAARWKMRGPALAEVVPGVWFGRRLTAAEATAAEPPWTGVLDLAGEFVEAVPMRRLPGYLSLPVLDATAPTLDQLRTAMTWFEQTLTTGPVFVHCALGHGRSATFVIAWLLQTGQIKSLDEGERRLKSLRPGVGLNRVQRERLDEFQRTLLK